MTQLAYLQTVRPVKNPHVSKTPQGEERFEAIVADRFSAESGYTIEDLGVKVRITGKHGSVLVPWTAISYAEELPTPEPSTPQPETAKAAVSPRAKQGGK